MIITAGIYFLSGLVCLFMGIKSITSNKFLPFHEKAAGKSWENIDGKLQEILLALLRTSGLGFLVTGFLLALFMPLNYFIKDSFIKYASPAIALIFCFGLFLFNFRLYRRTGAETPWKGSVGAFVVILAALALSILE